MKKFFLSVLFLLPLSCALRTAERPSPLSEVTPPLGAWHILESGLPSVRLDYPSASSVLSGASRADVSVAAGGGFTPAEYLTLYLFLDGSVDLAGSAQVAVRGATNSVFSLPLNTYSLRNGLHTLRPALKLLRDGKRYYKLGGETVFCVSNNYVPVLDRADATGDCRGPASNLTPPANGGQDGTFSDAYYDLTRAAVSIAGSNLKISLFLRGLSRSWTPANGFDHVSFQIFLDDPSKTGLRVLPRQNARLPAGMTDWDYEIFAEGWSSRVTGTAGANAGNFGSATGKADVAVDPAGNEIDLLVYPDSIGSPASLEGWTIYITTFDYDGLSSDFRRVSPPSAEPDYDFHCSSPAAFDAEGKYAGPKLLDTWGPYKIGH